MTKRLRMWFYSMCMFLSFCGWSFADIPRTPEGKQAPTLVGWHEPPSCFKQGERSLQDCVYWLNQLGVEHLNDKRYEHAVARFSQLLSLREIAVVYASRGSAYARQDKYPEAHRDFLRATTLDPGMDEPFANLAEIDLKYKRLPQALAHIMRALALKPHQADYLLIRAEVFIALGQHRRAAGDMRAAIAVMRAPLPEIVVNAETSKNSVQSR